jgi:hypothetical protein
MFCFGLSKFTQLPIYYSLLIMKSRRSRGFTVGDRVRGLIGSIGTSTGVITKLLKGSRVEVRWDEGPCAGVTEPRSVDQLVAHISTSLAPDVVDRNDTDRRCGLPGCDEPVFIWDQNVNVKACNETYLGSLMELIGWLCFVKCQYCFSCSLRSLKLANLK